MKAGFIVASSKWLEKRTKTALSRGQRFLTRILYRLVTKFSRKAVLIIKYCSTLTLIASVLFFVNFSFTNSKKLSQPSLQIFTTRKRIPQSEANEIEETTTRIHREIASIELNNCSSENDNLKGPLNVTGILEEFNLTTLVELHESNGTDMSIDGFSIKNASFVYLKNESWNNTNKHPRFDEFWELWHTTNLSILNISKQLLGKDGGRVELGGSWRPNNCSSRHKIFIIIPFRDRIPHLRVNLEYLHTILQRQMIDYRIFVIEGYYAPGVPFNKGRVMNAGFLEAIKIDRTVNCVIFHDVDLILEDDRNVYFCEDFPRHISVLIDKYGYRLPYDNLVGGVLAIRPEVYKKANGYSNAYWGWGGEDDDFATRLNYSKLRVLRPPGEIGRYRMMHHKYMSINSNRHKMLGKVNKFSRFRDGLTSIRYTILKYELFTGFTYFLLDVSKTDEIKKKN